MRSIASLKVGAASVVHTKDRLRSVRGLNLQSGVDAKDDFDFGQAGFRIESMRWLNMFGIPGWWFNARILRRDRLPAFQLAVYNVLSRVVLPIENWIGPPVGLSLVAIAKPED